jgi:hypothetical protein
MLIVWKGSLIGKGISGLYYKHVMIVNYASSGINKLRASLNDDARVIIYDHHMFIVQATGGGIHKSFYNNLVTILQVGVH